MWNSISSRISQIEQKLTQKGIKVRLNNLKKIAKRLDDQRKSKIGTYISHINATLDFIDRMRTIFDQSIREVEAEPVVNKGDIDILMSINNENYSFQIKARNVIGAYGYKWVKEDQWIYEDVLSDFGIFARVIKWRKEFGETKFRPLEKKKVSSVDDFSMAVIFESIDSFKGSELNALKRNMRKGEGQLKDSYGYRILVYDVRLAPISTEVLVEKTKELLREYDSLSGVILMRLGLERYTGDVIPYLFPIPNHNSKKSLDKSFYRYLSYSQLDVKLLEPKWLLSLPTKIYFEETGWQEFLDIRPGYKVFRKGVYMGSILFLW